MAEFFTKLKAAARAGTAGHMPVVDTVFFKGRIDFMGALFEEKRYYNALCIEGMSGRGVLELQSLSRTLPPLIGSESD